MRSGLTAGASAATSLGARPGLCVRVDGEGHRELASRTVALTVNVDRAAVERDQIAHECQADAESRLRPLQRYIALHEHVEDLRQHVRRDADSGIANPNAHLIRRLRRWLADRFRDQPDVAAWRRELDRIVQQIDEDLRQADRIAIERHRLVRK